MENKNIDDLRGVLEETVKVYVNKEMSDQLKQDASFFIGGKDDTPNMNKFLNLLIINHIDAFAEQVNSCANHMSRWLQSIDHSISDTEALSLAKKEAFELLKKQSAYEKDLNYKFSIHILKDSIDPIIESMIQSSGIVKVSEYIRGIFSSYLSLPLYKREQVIHKATLDKINRIISSGCKLRYKLKTKPESRVFNPKFIKQSRYEYRNYLIGQQEEGHKYISAIKLSNIEHIYEMSSQAKFSDNFNDCMIIMEENGVQFPVSTIETHKLELTESGVTAFNAHYIDRPKAVLITKLDNGNLLYEFNCSKNQIDSYFFPFKDKICD